MSAGADFTEVRVPDGDRCLIVHERGDDELTVIAQCMAALATLTPAEAARAAAYLADRHPSEAQA